MWNMYLLDAKVVQLELATELSTGSPQPWELSLTSLSRWNYMGPELSIKGKYRKS